MVLESYMPRSRRPKFVSVLLVAVLGVLATAFGPAARAATADNFYIDSAGSPSTAVGLLSTVLSDYPNSSPITAVTAHLIAQDKTDALDLALTQTASTVTSGYTVTTWTVPTPITVSQLALGNYTIALDVTFQDGSTLSPAQAGTLHFLDVAMVTMTADHNDVGYDYNPVINISGAVQILAPDGTTTPYANSGLTLLSNAIPTIPSQPLTTDGAGAFSAQLTTTQIGAAEIILPAVSTMMQNGGVITFNEVYDPVKVTARLTTAAVRVGTKGTVTGVLSYLPKDTGSTYVPLASHHVALYSPISGSTVATTTSDSTGHYSLTVPAVSETTPWTVEAGRTAGDTLFDPAQANVAETALVPLAITKFSVRLSQYWQLGFSGCFGPAAGEPYAYFPTTKGLSFQYSSGGANGPWHTLVASIPDGSSRCGNGGLWFSWQAVAPVNWAYYRVHYSGSKDTNGTVYQAATSASVLAWKYGDRITNFSVSPTVVSGNGHVTVKGQLQYYANSAWHNYGGQTIYILFRQKGTSKWYWIVKVTANSTGHFAATVPVAGIGSATWTAQFNGNSTHLATAPPGVYVRVTG
jgi:hypothetical protein